MLFMRLRFSGLDNIAKRKEGVAFIPVDLAAAEPDEKVAVIVPITLEIAEIAVETAIRVHAHTRDLVLIDEVFRKITLLVERRIPVVSGELADLLFNDKFDALSPNKDVSLCAP